MDFQNSIRLQMSRLERILRHRTEFSKLPSDKLNEFYLKNQIDETRSDFKAFMNTHERLILEISSEDFEKSQYFIEKPDEDYEECYFEFISSLEQKLQNLIESKILLSNLSNVGNSQFYSENSENVNPPGKPID